MTAVRTVVHLLRHGEVHNPRGILYGRLAGYQLSERGRDQADVVALLAANRDRIDVDLIRREWGIFASTEPDRTAWLEDAIARIVPPAGEGP